MKSQPQNPEFRNNPENFHPCVCMCTLFTIDLFTGLIPVSKHFLWHVFKFLHLFKK